MIGGLSTSNDVATRAGAGVLATAPEISYVQNRTNGAGGVFSFPGSTQTSPIVEPGFFGPSFTFTSVPEINVGSGAVPLAFVMFVMLVLSDGRKRKASS